MHTELQFRSRMKNKASVLIAISCCIFSLVLFLAPRKAQTRGSGPRVNDTAQKEQSVYPPQQQIGGLNYVVNTTSDTAATSACQNGTAGCSLRGAILAANGDANADGISFAIPSSDPGCTAGACTISIMTVLPAISTSIGITGPGLDKIIVRAATGTVSVYIFDVSATGTLTLSGLTLRDGQNAGAGGAIRNNSGGTVNVLGCTITGNQAIHGGTAAGIYNAGTLNVINTTVSGNQNTTGNGGGVVNSAGTANIINSTISGNSGNVNGGGIYNIFGGTVNVTNSTIVGNTAIGSTIGRGGGIHNAEGTVNIKNSVVAMNSSSETGPDVRGTFVSAGYNLIGKTDGSTGFTAATDQTGTIAAPLDPQLDPGGLQYNGGVTRTIAVRAGSPAIDKGTSVGLTGVLTTDQRGSGFPRTYDDAAVPNAPGGDGTDIGAYERLRMRAPFDFDGDEKTDIGITRMATTLEWWLTYSGGGNFAAAFGSASDVMAPADFTGDGKADMTVFRPSTGFWYVLRSEDLTFFAFPFGTNGDVPAPGDFDADGRDDAAVFRPSSSMWYQLLSGGGSAAFHFGAPGDHPVVGDYDGDTVSDVAIFRPGDGSWWISRSTAGLFVTVFGSAMDKPVPGDHTGDGKTDVAVWRPSSGTWYILRSENQSFYAFPWGISGDIPAPGDYDGDGKWDAAIFRPTDATWYVNRSTGAPLITRFGASGDRPIPNAFIP